MNQSTPILVIVGGVVVGIILIFCVLRDSNYSPFAHRVPPPEITGGAH